MLLSKIFTLLLKADLQSNPKGITECLRSPFVRKCSVAWFCVKPCTVSAALWDHLGSCSEESPSPRAVERPAGHAGPVRGLPAAQGAVLPRFSWAVRASWKLTVIKTNVKRLQNTAEMRTVVSSRLSGAGPVLFQRNVLNIKLLMLIKGSGPTVKDCAFPPQRSHLQGWWMYAHSKLLFLLSVTGITSQSGIVLTSPENCTG